MTDAHRELRSAHRSNLAGRVEALQTCVQEVGAGPECRCRAHALKGAALILGLDGLAVAAAALEAACDEAGGDRAAALRAIEVARRAVDDDVACSAAVRHDLRGGLSIVLGHASLLELEPLTARQRQSVAEILAAADSMTAALDALEGVGGTAPEQAPVTPGPPRRVLVVEDDQVTAGVVERMLVELGATVTVADTTAAAVAAAVAQPPDIVLLDLGLGEDDGREVLRALRAAAGLERVPIVISSGRAGVILRRALGVDGASAIMPKPVTLDALRSLLAGH